MSSSQIFYYSDLRNPSILFRIIFQKISKSDETLPLIVLMCLDHIKSNKKMFKFFAH